MNTPGSPYTIANITLTDKEFRRFQELIYEWSGIYMSDAKRALVAGRLLKRLRYYQLSKFQQYIDIVEDPQNKVERQIMVNILTTNETYFFRESQHLDYLRDEILENYKRDGNFRVWSAATSSGQEAYSIAMVIDSKLGNTPWEIIGTDINEEVLEKAVQGIYPIEAADKIPTHYLKKYCLKGVRSQEGFFTVIDNIKKRITFQQLNLIESNPTFGLFDVVFLRNVMIYFNLETKQRLIEKITRYIKDQGYLILGHSENLNNISKNYKIVGPTIYRKQ